MAKQLELPVIVGTEDEQRPRYQQAAGRDRLRHARRGLRQHGLDDQRHHVSRRRQGILRYRGYPIEQLAEKCDFVEVCYLLIYGELPNANSSTSSSNTLKRHTMLHEDMRLFYNGFPRDAHPMAILSSRSWAR